MALKGDPHPYRPGWHRGSQASAPFLAQIFPSRPELSRKREQRNLAQIVPSRPELSRMREQWKLMLLAGFTGFATLTQTV